MENKKKCPKCGQEKPATEEFFGKNKSASDGLNYWCKICKSEYQKAEYKKDHKSKSKKGRDFKAEYKHRKNLKEKEPPPISQISDTILLEMPSKF